MFFPLAKDHRGVQGRFHKDNYTYYVRKGITYVRLQSRHVDPKTPAQQAMRAIWGELKKEWSRTLTRLQRENWTAWAHEKLVKTGLKHPQGPVAYNAWLSCALYRHALGLDFPAPSPPAILPEELCPSARCRQTAWVFSLTMPNRSLAANTS